METTTTGFEFFSSIVYIVPYWNTCATVKLTLLNLITTVLFALIQAVKFTLILGIMLP